METTSLPSSSSRNPQFIRSSLLPDEGSAAARKVYVQCNASTLSEACIISSLVCMYHTSTLPIGLQAVVCSVCNNTDMYAVRYVCIAAGNLRHRSTSSTFCLQDVSLFSVSGFKKGVIYGKVFCYSVSMRFWNQAREKKTERSDTVAGSCCFFDLGLGLFYAFFSNLVLSKF